MVKCKRKEGFREELISNKTVEFDDLGKFWTFQTCKEVKKQIYHPGPYTEEKAQRRWSWLFAHASDRTFTHIEGS